MRTAYEHVPVRRTASTRPRRPVAAGLVAALVALGLVLASPLPSGAAEAGSLDPAFGGNGTVVTDVGADTQDTGVDVAVQPDGKIVVAGTSGDDVLVLRYNADGTLDTSFSGDGKLTQDISGADAGNAVALQPDGKILVAGSSGADTAFAVLRFTPAGALDTTFDTDGVVTEPFTGTATAATDVAFTGGGIVVAGSTGDPGDFALARYTEAGALDTGFDGDGTVITDVAASDDVATALAVQTDGALVVAGSSDDDVAVVRYTTAGLPDPTFDTDGRVLTSVTGGGFATSVAIAPGGQIVVGGGAGDDSLLLRYTAAGALDPAFSGDGTVVTDWGTSSQIWSVGVQPDGRIVTAGENPTASGDFLVARYAADGSLDPTFDGDGMVRTNLGGDSRSLALALQPDGKIVVAGQVVTATDGEVAVARYLGTADAPTPAAPLGYRMVAADGGIFTFGERSFRGSTGDMTLNKPIVGGATNPATVDGYWIVASDGGVFSFGDVGFYGSLANTALDSPVAEIEPTPSGQGYWMVTAKGKVYPFGDAVFYGDATALNLNQPIVGMTTTSSGQGYWLLGADGGIFSHGDAQFFGSTGNMTLNAPVVDIAGVPGDDGYFLVAGDGGVFTFGSAEFKGSTGDMRLNQPVNSMLVTPDGEGYWLAASDGGVFTFGNATFLGSMGAVRLNAPVLDMIL